MSGGLDKRALVFPEKYEAVNKRAFDVDVHGYIALGTGATVNLACIRGNSIERCYSFSVNSGNVSSLIFTWKSMLFIGTSTGVIYCYSLAKRKFVCEEIPGKDMGGVLKIGKLGELIVVMYSSGKIVSYGIVSHQDERIDILPQWEIVLSGKFNDFVVDPIKGERIFVYGRDTGSFSIYAVKSGATPKVLVEAFTLSDNLIIQTAIFSEHINRYVIMVTEQVLLWYDIDLNLIASVQHHQKTVSQFDTVIQFPNDHRKLLALHKTGTISLYEVTDNFELHVLKEVKHYAQTQSIVSIAASPMRDDQLVVYYAPLGLALLDAASFTMVSVCPLMTDCVTAIGSDGLSCVFGTSTGNVRVTNLDNVTQCFLYRVSEHPIRFVSVISKERKVYWATKTDFGVIDIRDRFVKMMPRKALPIIKIACSLSGGLVVQRDERVLGIFIDGVEHYWASESRITDFCLNHQRSSTSKGDVAILTRKNNVIVLSYSAAKGIEKRVSKRKLEADSTATTIGWSGNRYAVGFTNGSVSVYHLQNGARQRNSLVKNSSITAATVYDDVVIGLTHDGTLFEIDDSGKCVLYPHAISHYVVVRSKVILVLHTSGKLAFLKTPGFESLAVSSNALNLPQLKELQADAILSNPVMSDEKDYIPTLFSRKKKGHGGICYMSKEGRDFWLHLLNRQPLRMMLHAADGESQEYEQTIAKIVTMSTPTNVLQRHKIFMTLLYANRFTEAADSLFAGAGASSVDGLMKSTILAVAVNGFENGVSEEQCARIKPAGISLILNGHASSGANLLKLAKLDSVAIEYLLQTGRTASALRFIRTLDSAEERKGYCFQIATMFWEKKRVRDAFFFFLAAGEIHPALFALHSMKLILDAFFLKHYLLENNLLVDISEEKAQKIPGLVTVSALCRLIDTDFRRRLENLDIPVERFFPEH